MTDDLQQPHAGRFVLTKTVYSIDDEEIKYADPLLNAKIIGDNVVIPLSEFLAWFAKLQREILG